MIAKERQSSSLDFKKMKRKCSTTLDLNENLTEEEPKKIPSPISENLMTRLNILEHLKINKSEITSLPPEVFSLQNLKHLDASENKIMDLSEDLTKLENLQILNLSFNQLSKLPSSCLMLNNLQELHISNNKFTSLPECLQNGIENLKILDISYNPLKFIGPPASKKLKCFIAKGLKHCRFFPEWLLNPKYWRLKEVILDESIFLKFSFQTDSILHWRKISMSNCCLNDFNFQKIASHMIGLEIIHVHNCVQKIEQHYNKFCFFPGINLRNLTSVIEINTRRTGLSMLPNLIFNFCNLKKLDLGFNNFGWLPHEICELKYLEVLIIDHCKLEGLPEKFGELRKLEEFVAYNNRLTKLPESMAKMENLRILDLYDNEFTEMPNFEWEKLECLDFDRNFFEIKNQLIRNTPYDVLKEKLRKHYNCQRDVGLKTYKKDEEDEKPEMGPFESCSDSESEGVTPEENKIVTVENWGSPENSADEYEPGREAKLKRPAPRSLYQFHVNYSSYFRPADYHERRVREDIKRKKRKGLIRNSSYTTVEGQFDDA